MAVKASIQITLSKVIDIAAVYRYYKLQASTLSKPAKPTTYPPSGWDGTEPAYTSGSTKTLYFVDCNVYSDGSFSFSDVSKSSSYEAAKDAWNKANKAQETIENLEVDLNNILRYDDTKITLGKTGSNTTLNLKNDAVSIENGDVTNATFESDKLALGNGYLNLGYGANDGNIHSGTYLMTETSNTIDVFLKDIANPDGGNYGASVQLHNTGTYYGTKITGGDASIGAYVNDIDSVIPDASTIKLDAGRVHVAASKAFTYDIPVLQSGDCNTLIRSGKWYLGDNSTNRPIDKNGWLETKLYSTDYCHQTYTTYDGMKYNRVMQGGTWGAWNNSTIIPMPSTDSRLMILGPLRIIQGTCIVTGVGKAYQKLITLEALKTRFGLTSINSNNVYMNAMNGDASANGLTTMGVQYWSGDGFYVYFNQALASGVRMRINYLYVYLDL